MLTSELASRQWTSLENNVPPRIITITDRDMANFKRVAMADDDSVMFLGNKDFSQKIGRKVRVNYLAVLQKVANFASDI